MQICTTKQGRFWIQFKKIVKDEEGNEIKRRYAGRLGAPSGHELEFYALAEGQRFNAATGAEIPIYSIEGVRVG